MTKWSDSAWEASEHIYRHILELPFVRQLAEGTLDRGIFNRYIGQDSLYINCYCRVLAHIASRVNDSEMRANFLRFASEGVDVESQLHSLYISDRPAQMSPACLFYTALLQAQALEPVEVEAAAILPCFWVYIKVGQHIAASMKPGNPYADWINCYADPSFDESNNIAISMCDKLAASASPEVREKMTKVFKEGTRMEWLFWHSAYSDIKWPSTIADI